MDPASSAAEFTTALTRLFGDDLRTVLLYGSAAGGEYRSGISDINLLVILRELGVEQLRMAAPDCRDWVAQGNPPPLMLSEPEWRSSADAFPIEYSDIRERHALLAGENPFAGVTIRRVDLRHQLEHELRSRKIQLREVYLASGSIPEEFGPMLVRSLSSFLTLFRSVLRLVDINPPTDPDALVRQVATRVGFDPDPVVEVVRYRELDTPPATPIDGPLAAGYLAAVERTVDWLDAFDPAGSGEFI